MPDLYFIAYKCSNVKRETVIDLCMPLSDDVVTYHG